MPSKLEQLQLQFRQRLMQEKEERMIKIHTINQQKALSKVSRYDNAPPIASRKPPTTQSPMTQSPTKKNSPGVDRSRPLPPISREFQQPAIRNGNGYYPSNNRNHHHSSNCSEPSARVSIQNGMRARSVDSQMSDGVKRNARNNMSSEMVRTNYGRKSPEVDVWTHGKQYQRSQGNHKLNYDTTIKVTNHSGLTNGTKSSDTKAGYSQRLKPPPPSTATAATTAATAATATTTAASVIRNRTKAMVANGSRKPTQTAPKPPSRQKPQGRATVPARKPPNPHQEQCSSCGRNFNKDRIDKHVSICSKTFQKKVKVFDTTQMRVIGTEAESYVHRNGVTVLPDPQKSKKKNNWKKQHEDFITAIRQAKVAQRHLAAGGKLSDLPPPPPSDTSHYVPCPYCGRKFNEGVAQRHIPKCKNIVCNKKGPIKKK